MTNVLLDPLRHNVWATKELIAFCRDLTPEQLDASAEGTYGSIVTTLQHLVGADRRYRMRLAGETPEREDPAESAGLDELSRMMEDLGTSWDSFASDEFDPERVIEYRSVDGTEDVAVRAGVLVAQALNHGNEHRAQVFTVLTTLGIEPPELDGWHYAFATDRLQVTPPPDASS